MGLLSKAGDDVINDDGHQYQILITNLSLCSRQLVSKSRMTLQKWLLATCGPRSTTSLDAVEVSSFEHL